MLASVGDLAMLWVVNARRPELALAQGPEALLAVAGLLGVVSIPLYGFGYTAAASLVGASQRRTARIVATAGTFGGIVGGVIHGLTARGIQARSAAGAPALDPLSELTGDPALLSLWIVAAAVVIAASVTFAIGVRATQGDALAAVNPAVVTLALVLLASPTEFGRSFLAPAAPNLAHVIFFAVCAAMLSHDAGGHWREP